MEGKDGTRAGRDPAFEALRVIAMPLILFCHAIALGPWGLEDAPGWAGVCAVVLDKLCGQAGVSLFLLTSGWFLVDHAFSLRRIVSLASQVHCYSLGILLVALVCDLVTRGASPFASLLGGEALPRTVLTSLFPIVNGQYWFVTAYFFVLLLQPALNAALQALPGRTVGALLVTLLAWSALAVVSVGDLWWTRLSYAATLYLLGGWLRLGGERWLRRFSARAMALAMVGCVAALALFVRAVKVAHPVATLLGWSHEKALGALPPATIVFGVCLFVLLRRALAGRCPRRPRLLALCSSSAFGIYLVHANIFLRRTLWELALRYIGEPVRLVPRLCVLAVVSVGAFCLLVPLVALFERAVVGPLRGLARRRVARLAR